LSTNPGTATFGVVVFGKQPYVFEILGVAAFVLIAGSILVFIADVVSTPFVNRRNRNKVIEEVREQGGQKAVDRFLEKEKAHKTLPKTPLKDDPVVKAIVGDTKVEKAVAVGVAVFVVVAALIALTR